MGTEKDRKFRLNKIFKHIYDEGIIEKDVLIARCSLWWGTARRTALEYIKTVVLASEEINEKDNIIRVGEFKNVKGGLNNYDKTNERRLGTSKETSRNRNEERNDPDRTCIEFIEYCGKKS